MFRPIGTDIELYAKTPPTPVTNGQPPIIMWPVSNLYTLSLFYKCLREAAGGFYDLRTYYKGIDVSNGLEGMYMLGQNSPRIICEGHSYPGQSLLLPAPSTIGKNFDQITGWSKTVQRCPEISFQVDSRGFFPTLGNNSRLTLVIMGFQTDGSRSMPIAEKSLSWNTRQVVNFDFARYQDSWYWLVMPIEEPGTETEMPEIPYAPE